MKQGLLWIAIGILFAGVVSADPTNGPQIPGQSGVYRLYIGEASGCLVFLDAETQIISVNTLADGLCGCATATVGTPVSIQQINVTDEIIHQLAFAPSHFANVYDWTGFPETDCAFLLNETGRLMATGTARLVITDNDITNAGPGGNSYGWSAHGTLFNVWDGEGTVNLTVASRAVILPSGEFLPVVWDTVRLSPDPR